MQTHAQSSGNTELFGSCPGGSQDSTCQVSDMGVTSESHRKSGAGQANRTTGSRRGNSPPGRGEPDEFKEILLYQETQTGERLYACAECRKTFKLKIGLLKQKQIHTRKNQVLSHIRTDCGKSFGRHADLIRHQRAHAGERPYKRTASDKSFTEKPRPMNHLRTHNIGL